MFVWCSPHLIPVIIFCCRNVECLNLLLSSGTDLNKRDVMGRWVSPPFLPQTGLTEVPLSSLSPPSFLTGHRCTMRLLMGGISALWPWWALALRSTSLTRQAVLPCTTLLPPKPSAGLGNPHLSLDVLSESPDQHEPPNSAHILQNTEWWSDWLIFS